MKNLTLCVMLACSVNLAQARVTNSITEVNAAIGSLERCLSRAQKNVPVILDCGISFATNGEYEVLTRCVSNDWQNVLGNLDRCASNQFQRLVVLSVRDRFGADFYIDFIGKLVDLRTNGVLSAEELDWAMYTTDPELENYFERKYRNQRVRALAVRIRAVSNHTNYWDRVLSGLAYTNYIDEVETGLWGENPPR